MFWVSNCVGGCPVLAGISGAVFRSVALPPSGGMPATARPDAAGVDAWVGAVAGAAAAGVAEVVAVAEVDGAELQPETTVRAVRIAAAVAAGTERFMRQFEHDRPH
jgi:hypothetical protein